MPGPQAAPGRAVHGLHGRRCSAGNVAEITSRGDAIQGDFNKPVTVPADEADRRRRPYARFETEQPTFADTALSSAAREERSCRSTRSRSTRRTLVCSTLLLLGFGPTLLLIAHLRLHRRAAAARRRRGGIGGFGRSQAKRYEADATSAPPSPTSRASTRPRRSWPRSSTSSSNPSATRGSAARSRRACCWPARPAPARRCSPARSPARRTCRSSRCRASEFVEMIVGVGASRVRDLFDQAKADARRRSSSSTSSTRSAAPARRRRVARRPRRARADAEPDPDRDGRLHRLRGRDRAGRDQPARGPRRGAAAARPLRPPRRSCNPPDARRPRADPARAHARRAAGRRRRPEVDRRRARRAWSAPTSRTSSTRRR